MTIFSVMACKKGGCFACRRSVWRAKNFEVAAYYAVDFPSRQPTRPAPGHPGADADASTTGLHPMNSDHGAVRDNAALGDDHNAVADVVMSVIHFVRLARRRNDDVVP